MTSSTASSSRRLVIDSNVWISALVFGGQPRKMLEQAVRDGSVLLISEQILTEVRRILQQKFPDFEQDFEALLIALGQRIATVPLGAITIGVCRDPDDNHVLETAVLGRAGIIISGDKDLLSLGTYEKISIVTPNTFVTHS